MCPQNILVDTRLIVIAPDKAFGNDLDQIFIACLIFCQENKMPLIFIFFCFLIRKLACRRIDLASNDRLDPLLLTFFIKVYRTEHDPMICDRQAFHPQFLGSCHHIRDAGSSVQQTVFGMNM